MSVLGDRVRRATRRAFERTFDRFLGSLLARKICPTCHERQLEPDPEGTLVGGSVAYVAAYRCRSCSGQWRSLDDGPLIPRTAWDAGVRDDGSAEIPLARSLWRAAKRARDRATSLIEPLLARKVCPECSTRTLEPDPEHATEQQGASVVAAYRCRQCSGQWRNLDGGALISRMEWDDGIRGTEVPTATARTRSR